MTELTLSTGEPIPLQPAPVKKFRGIRLPGADLFQSNRAEFVVAVHKYMRPLFRFSLRTFSSRTPVAFVVRETTNYIRLETVLTGELTIHESAGKEIKLKPGEYRMSEVQSNRVSFGASESCVCFVVYISPELIKQTPLGEKIIPSHVLMMPPPMRAVVSRMLDNPFEDKVREGFYDYSIRELLFYHVSAPVFTLPGDLTPEEVAMIYEADQIIAADLSVHYPIHVLAKMLKTNTFLLKSGFAKIFGMGTFERLLQRKMERAKYLLETTDKQVQDIALMAGYETVTGFINSFRREFKMSPREWRKKSRGLS